MTYVKKQVLPTLNNSDKVSKPDLTAIGNQNYTSTILKYGNLTLPFSQLDTDAKTIVAAINELYARPSGGGHSVLNGGGSIVIPNPITGTDTVLGTDTGSYIVTNLGMYIEVFQGDPVGDLYSVSIDGDIYTIGGGGSGDGKHRTLTQAEYDALSESEKNNGTIYFISDQPAVTISPEDLKSTNASKGQLLYYNRLGIWEPTYGVEDPQNGDVLIYDGETESWKNASVGSATKLGDLTDVVIDSPSAGQALIYDEQSEDWVNGQVSMVGELDDLEDVEINNPASGQALIYDDQTGDWVNGNVSTVETLNELADVTITNPTSKQVLKYNGNQWINDIGGDTWEGTQAQYNALPVKDPNTVYFITDAPSQTFNADAVMYNNTRSGLLATTVQSALDEIVETNVYWTDLTGTLMTGATTIQFHNSAIKRNSTVNVYVDSAFFGVSPISMSVIDDYVTLGFEEQTMDMPVKVRIS